MNIPEEQRKLIKAIEETKDVNKLCEYLNTDYERMSGLDKKSFVAIDGIIYQISTVDLAHGSKNTALIYEHMHQMRYEVVVFKGLFLGLFIEGEPIYTKRYKTEEEAIAGHEHILSKIEDIVKLVV